LFCFFLKGAWLALFPETGRKHQLRVHCASVLEAPILGDLKYGYGVEAGKPDIAVSLSSFKRRTNFQQSLID
jgi:23S rRNA-/tRNA-specific pseudouridylate synthase